MSAPYVGLDSQFIVDIIIVVYVLVTLFFVIRMIWENHICIKYVIFVTLYILGLKNVISRQQEKRMKNNHKNLLYL